MQSITVVVMNEKGKPFPIDKFQDTRNFATSLLPVNRTYVRYVNHNKKTNVMASKYELKFPLIYSFTNDIYVELCT